MAHSWNLIRISATKTNKLVKFFPIDLTIETVIISFPLKMIDFLNSFKSLIKLEQVHTDNNVFKLHYKFTVIMLIVFSILLTSKQYFGEPINCDVDERKSLIDLYCWIYGTYIIRKTLTEDILGGLGNELEFNPNSWIDQNLTPKSNDDIIWQKYYQWVCIVFCFQALLFYLPRYLWKTWEGGRLHHLVKDLNGPIIMPCWNGEVKSTLITYLMGGKYAHNLYSLRYVFCEILNFLNVVIQIYLMDWFLSGHFTMYGAAVSTFNGKINPMNEVFPKLTKCKYFRYGATGTKETRDALCLLPLNVLNEKLFLLLWFWLFALSILSLLSLIYRCFIITFLQMRIYLLMAQTRFIQYKQARLIVNELSYGDFFVLHLIGKNINPIIFKELVLGIYDYLNNRKVLKAPQINEV